MSTTAHDPSPAAAAATVAMAVADISYRYGERLALDGLSFAVDEGEIFGLLGPNGGGKTTLFELLSSLRPLQEGSVTVYGRSLAREAVGVRRSFGVAFQAPSLDVHLRVRENLVHQGHLYGLRGTGLAARIDELLERFDLGDRAGDKVGDLSGGLARRVEIAKALIHRPRLLLLDEPSTGLDPGIRRELWALLEELRQGESVTVLLTTHFMEEGDRCDRVGLLDSGRLVAEGRPGDLKQQLGGDVVRIATGAPEAVRKALASGFGIDARTGRDLVWFEQQDAHQQMVAVVEALAGQIRSISVAQPTLEDVFLEVTGHAFMEAGA